ncbi:protein N-lysine methyltransferase METTL21A-like isoform X2 [Ostrea edulis]|uniref:protein N-lysine methyltransferase METTL21A-like isoform X2 n=1 Tax=Ostrea edulis TaxID=37623 RepID=UPI0020965FBD|nr:protein N-lysine methyltransferase METTL21A-like isoform X2 [Ostrea edulis]
MFLIQIVNIIFCITCGYSENHHHCVQTKSTDESCDALKTTEPSMALVPYNPNNDVLAVFNKPERVFRFVEKELKIPQDWNNLGVAAVVWDAAIVLCEYLETGNVVLEHKKVIELGAGSGLVGIVATLLGAQTIITDQEKALPYLTKAVRNNLPDNFKDKYKVQALDWRGDLETYTETFDVILGADIIYIEDTFPDLLRTIIHLNVGLRRLLCGSMKEN